MLATTRSYENRSLNSAHFNKLEKLKHNETIIYLEELIIVNIVNQNKIAIQEKFSFV